MPSLWSRIGARSRNYQTEESSKPAKDKNRPSRMKRLFSFGSKDKKVPQNANVQRQTSLNTDPVFPHMAPKSKGIERAVDEEKEAERKILSNIIDSNQNSNRRRLAYEIFQDPGKPRTPVSQRNGKPNFVSEPCLAQEQKSSQNSTPQWQRHVKNRDDIHNVERRPQKPGLFSGFSGFSSREQRHSVVGDYPFQQRQQIKGLQAKRSDSMYGYVPRAVSLHDATSLLLGKDKEETPIYNNSMLDQFAPCPSWGAGYGIPEEMAGDNDDISFSSLETEIRRPYSQNGLEAIAGPGDLDRFTDRLLPNKSQKGEGNFYFSQPSLNIKSENEVSQRDYEFWTAGASKSKNISTSDILENSMPVDGKGEEDVKNSKSNNNNNYYIVTGDNIHVERENKDNMPSVLDDFDKLNGNVPAEKTDKEQLEGLFGSVGEVLY